MASTYANRTLQNSWHHQHQGIYPPHFVAPALSRLISFFIVCNVEQNNFGATIWLRQKCDSLTTVWLNAAPCTLMCDSLTTVWLNAAPCTLMCDSLTTVWLNAAPCTLMCDSLTTVWLNAAPCTLMSDSLTTVWLNAAPCTLMCDSLTTVWLNAAPCTLMCRQFQTAISKQPPDGQKTWTLVHRSPVSI